MKRILFAALTAAALFSGGILQSLNAQNMEIPKKVSPFPVGDKLPEQFSKYFVGQAWLAPLTDDKRLNAPVSNVTFSPGCRNNWHSHTGGQLLIAVGGRGYYQEKGRPKMTPLRNNGMPNRNRGTEPLREMPYFCIVKPFF